MEVQTSRAWITLKDIDLLEVGHEFLVLSRLGSEMDQVDASGLVRSKEVFNDLRIKISVMSLERPADSTRTRSVA